MTAWKDVGNTIVSQRGHKRLSTPCEHPLEESAMEPGWETGHLLQLTGLDQHHSAAVFVHTTVCVCLYNSEPQRENGLDNQIIKLVEKLEQKGSQIQFKG